MSQITLRTEQKKFIDYAMDNLDKFNICEMPTAFGKTITALSLAKLVSQSKKKRVVIVTSNNTLVKQMKTQADKMNIDAGVVIGADNYVNIDYIHLAHKIIDTKKSINFAREKIKNDGYLLVDDLLEFLNIEDIEDIQLLKTTITGNKKYKVDLSDYDISITNYAYLLIDKIYVNKENKDDTFYIFDEIHELDKMAELLFSHRFSIYRLYSLTNILIDKLEKEEIPLQKTFIKQLKQYSSHINNIHLTLRNKELAGSSILDYDNKKLQLHKKNIFELEVLTQINKKIEKLSKKANFREMIFLKNELQEGKNIFNSNDVVVHYSQVYGYISYSTLSANVSYELSVKFWDNIQSFIGMSATALISKDIKQNLYMYKKIGVNFNDIKTDKKIIKSKKFNCMPIQSFNGILSPNQAEYIITKIQPTENSKSNIESVLNEVYANIEDKNSLILAGSYDDVDFIKKRLLKMDKSLKIISSERGIPMSYTINHFKKEGGVLIATRNYNTGISLEKEQLERLFIIKIPFPIAHNKKWIKLKEKNPKYFWFEYLNETMINFRQAIGRLIRTKEDIGKIFILDTRINSNRYSNSFKQNIEYFLSKIAIKKEI